MTQVTVTRRIGAPTEIIFNAIADISNLPNTNPDIVGVEFLTEQKSGLGTRFRETRRMNKGKELITELEVTEYAENDRIRMVADTHGTVWDTVFEVKPSGESTELTITMDARAHKLLPRLMNPLFKGLFRKGLEQHMVTFAQFCERASERAS